MFSSFSSNPPVSASRNCSTDMISGILSRRRLSIPIFNVIDELGHEPQAPCSLRTTTSPSISCSATFPPSAIRAGRTSSSTLSTFSSVNGITQLGDTTWPVLQEPNHNLNVLRDLVIKYEFLFTCTFWRRSSLASIRKLYSLELAPEECAAFGRDPVTIWNCVLTQRERRKKKKVIFLQGNDDEGENNTLELRSEER